jgi:hypothetical protein
MALVRRRIKQQNYGLPSALSNANPEVILSAAAPTTADHVEKGQIVVTDANTVHVYGGITAGTTTGVWYNLASGVGNFTTAVASTSLTTPLVINDSANLSLTTTTTGDIIVNSVDSLTVAAGDTSSITVDSGDLSLITTTTGDVIVTAVDAASMMAGTTLDLDAVGVLSINSSAAAINVGNDAVAQAINIGTGAAARTLTIGNVSGTTGIVVNTGTNGLDINTTGAGTVTVDTSLFSIDSTLTSNITVTGAAQDLYLASSGGGISINSDAASATAVGIRATDAAGGVFLDAGTGGLSIDVIGGTVDINSTTGMVTMSPLVDTQAATTVTINATVGVGTFTGVTTAAAASEVFTVTNSVCTATSAILCTIASVGAEDAQMTIQRVKPMAGSFTVTCKNNGAAALASNAILTFWIIRP